MAEKEYIDREAAMAAACKALCYPGVLCPDFKCVEVRDAFNAIPAADVRPVVLCKDFQNSYEWANMDGDNYRYCGYLRSRWNHDADRMVNDDDFCKWGEKREES